MKYIDKYILVYYKREPFLTYACMYRKEQLVTYSLPLDPCRSLPVPEHVLPVPGY